MMFVAIRTPPAGSDPRTQAWRRQARFSWGRREEKVQISCPRSDDGFHRGNTSAQNPASQAACASWKNRIRPYVCVDGFVLEPFGRLQRL